MMMMMMMMSVLRPSVHASMGWTAVPLQLPGS